MKVVERVLDVTSTLEGEKIGMTINTDALSKIMSILTDLYSNPTLAVIREYSTNAFDAHVEAGVTRPIEVTLPSPLAPFFTVRDYGYGLDIDDIRDIYSQYGASTKTSSNDLVGMLGLGCKSALTYTNQFTLSAVKNGILTTVAVSRDADGAGSMTVVEEIPTDEPSGTTVIVPVKAQNDFEEEAKNFFRFWNQGTVLVNGKEPTRIGDKQGLWLDESTLLTPEVDHSYIVMGNVAYPWSGDGRVWNQWPTVAYVEIGAVEFTPSRESLQMTKLTEATLNSIKKHVSETKESAYQRLIDACETRAEALAMALVSSKIGIKGDKFEYNGETIPLQMTCKQDQRFIVADAVKRWRRRGWDWNRVIPATSWPKAIWLTGYDGADFSAHKRKKLEQWAEDKGLTGHESYILLDRMPKEIRPWVDKSRVFSWDEPKAVKIKVERQKRQDGRVSGSYSAYVDGQYVGSLLAADIDTSKPLFFHPGKYVSREELNVIEKNTKGYTIILLGRNRVNKFMRDFPAAKKLYESLREFAKKWADSLTPHDKLSLHLLASGDGRELKKFDPDRIDDPEFREAIKAAKRDTLKLQEQNKLYWRYLDNGTMASEWKNPLGKYLLLTSMSLYGTLNGEFGNHLYLYLNTAYAAEKETN